MNLIGKESPWLIRDNMAFVRASAVSRDPRAFDNIDPIVLANKSDIGTQAHAAIHAHLTDNLVVCRKDAWTYYDSWLAWYEHKQPVYLEKEKRYWCPDLRLTGQIDGLITLPDHDAPILIDYKTSAKENASTWVLQASLYCLLLQNHAVTCSKAIFLRLRRKKTVDPLGNVIFKPLRAIEHVYDIRSEQIAAARERLNHWHAINAPLLKVTQPA